MTENAPLPAASVQPVKALAEKLNLDAPNVTGIVVHAGLIYGHDGPGTVANMIQGAVSRGAATYIGDGANTWTPVHVDDIVDLYVLALSMPVAGIFNAVSSTPFSFRDLVEAIGELTGASLPNLPGTGAAPDGVIFPGAVSRRVRGGRECAPPGAICGRVESGD
ncbi:hypothetical protein C3B60_09345 [Cryobacterium zongtaii]|nr:hypothetical protein C3B60_09345 [Cryobacterium zongtaii]